MPRTEDRGLRTRLAEACRNRTNLSTLPRRNNGFEDRGSHQTPFASSHERRTRTITSLPHARSDEKSVHVQSRVPSREAAVRDVEEAVAGVERHPRVRKKHD